MHLDTFKDRITMKRKHHAKRIRIIHARYWLLMVNVALFGGMAVYGYTVRAAEISTDTAVLHSMMDSDSAVPYTMLMPPEVR